MVNQPVSGSSEEMEVRMGVVTVSSLVEVVMEMAETEVADVGIVEKA